jgi:hypothetical protein
MVGACDLRKRDKDFLTVSWTIFTVVIEDKNPLFAAGVLRVRHRVPRAVWLIEVWRKLQFKNEVKPT